ncbi:ABC transporter substrate-binding protein [Thioflexithrix psekupsensis]|uniref:Leucine-binding protein domain-containing protein n=1 Tax=Thioflexithrix psekupsensis TaxID=1570016 RepID=A0A251X7Z9_9GAMM|nr:ABC transporter substrate-binding protein [Thioflexithrix psekupsensis]OUD13803.1 hypothetical protein TPSD3_05475 [Thioflexithrix psekupsensis]
MYLFSRKVSITLVSLTIIVAIISYFVFFIKTANPIYIGFAGAAHKSSGKSIINGIELYLEMLNDKGGINGRKVKLITADDNGDPTLAEKAAQQLVDSEAVVVIGHGNSVTSIAASKVYKTAQLPVIAPTATHVDVTKDNPWYFRVIFNDEQQSKFLAYYATHIFQKKHAAIISDEQVYGRYLADKFTQFFTEQSGQLQHHWQLYQFFQSRMIILFK